MATTKGQRIGIAIILAVTVIGTIGGFAVMILASKNQAVAQAAFQAATTKYQNETNAYQAQVTAQSDALSATYYANFLQYKSRVASFDIHSVTTLSTEDLLVGTGEEITGTTKLLRTTTVGMQMATSSPG